MIGRARRRVVLQREEPIADGGGGFAPGWASVATIWADIRPVDGRERAGAGGLVASITHRVRVRRRTDVGPAMRLIGADGHALNIRVVLDREPLRPWLELLCEEGVAT